VVHGLKEIEVVPGLKKFEVVPRLKKMLRWFLDLKKC
jgi:hypothetical protein